MNIRPKFKLIFGLGNPDKQYESTYHNAGHLAIDLLEKTAELSTKISKSNTYMNESGKALKKLVKNTNIKPEEILVIQDDSDLFLGDFKLSFNRGSAGHKGIESIIRSLKTKVFWRLRIGIRPQPIKGRKRLRAEDFVLKKISLKDKKTLRETVKKACIFLTRS